MFHSGVKASHDNDFYSQVEYASSIVNVSMSHSVWWRLLRLIFVDEAVSCACFLLHPYI